MKIAVCVKQIPDPATPYELDPDTHFVSAPMTRCSTTPTDTVSKWACSSSKNR